MTIISVVAAILVAIVVLAIIYGIRNIHKPEKKLTLTITDEEMLVACGYGKEYKLRPPYADTYIKKRLKDTGFDLAKTMIEKYSDIDQSTTWEQEL